MYVVDGKQGHFDLSADYGPFSHSGFSPIVYTEKDSNDPVKEHYDFLSSIN